MGTEDRPLQYIDEMSPRKALNFLLKDLEAPRAVKKAKREILEAVTGAAARLKSEGRLIYVGAGTSGRLGVKDCAELDPTYGFPPERCVSDIAGGDQALRRSIEGSEDVVVAPLVKAQCLKITRNDVVIAIAASGRTPYTLAFMREAKEGGALTIGVASNAKTPILDESDHPIFLDTGAEPVAGSTRMKAGSAQDMFLKIFSTLLMVRLGYVYKGLMVNVRPRNQKLKDRAMKMVQTLTGCKEVAARESLETAEWEVGVAVLLLGGAPLNYARDLFIHTCKRNLADALAVEELIEATRGTLIDPMPVGSR